jgi:16S rRNA (guanine966-N2)-methyltransferase
LNQRIKITGGSARGRSISSFEGDRTRPTSSMVRQAIFNILGPIEGLSFLDLYGGTGSVGLEALSRGTAKAQWVEVHLPTSKLISQNLKDLKFDNGVVVNSKVTEFLGRAKEGFDIIFIDPPFVEEYPSDLDLTNVLKPDSIVLWQYPTKARIRWKQQPYKIYKYGESSLALFYMDS